MKINYLAFAIAGARSMDPKPQLPSLDALAKCMDQTYIALQFVVAQAHGEPVACGNCGQAINSPTDAIVRWYGEDNREEREILHASGELCVSAMVRDVA